MAEKYDIETPYKPVLERPDDLPPLPEAAQRPKGDLLDDLYRDDVLQEDDGAQARKAEPGVAPVAPSPSHRFDDIDLEGLPVPFSPEALRNSIGLIDQAVSEREELLKKSLRRLEERTKGLEANRKRLMAWELNNPDAAHRISHLERLIIALEDKADDRRIEFWKNVFPLKEKRLALEEELADAEQLEEEIEKIAWTG